MEPCSRPTSRLSIFALAILLQASFSASAQENPQAQPSDCVIKVGKSSDLNRVKLSKWRAGSGWWTNVEEPSEPGHVWKLVSGTIDCPSKGAGIPLPRVSLVTDSSKVFSLVGYAGPVEHNEEADFNFLEGAPGTGRTDAKGMVWGVIPAKGTGIMTLFLVDQRIAEKDVGITLLFSVPRSSGAYYLQIRDKRGEKVPPTVVSRPSQKVNL